MSANHWQRPATPRHDGDRYYPAPLPANRWVVPFFWLAVLLLAGLYYLA